MALRERLVLYQKMEELRGRPLVVFVTSTRPNAEGIIAGDVVPSFIDQLMVIPADTKQVDLLVASNGGDATVAWRIVSLLRERFDHVTVMVPQAAFSAATLLALGANEIILHPNGNLGPTDPQIEGVRTDDKGQKERTRFAAEDLAGFLRFAREEVGLTDQEHLRALFAGFCDEIGHVPVGVAARAVGLSMSLGERLLRLHMEKPEDESRIKQIVETLNKKFFMHGYPVGRKEAKELGLPIADNDPDVCDLMWRIWSDIESELDSRTVFDPLAEIAKNAAAAGAIFSPVQQVQAPPSVSGSISLQTVEVPPVDFRLVRVLLESIRVAAQHVSQGKILACRLPDMQFKIGVAHTGRGWETLDIPAPMTQNAVAPKEGAAVGDDDDGSSGGRAVRGDTEDGKEDA